MVKPPNPRLQQTRIACRSRAVTCLFVVLVHAGRVAMTARG
jgi:hypothetical protein